MCGFFFELDLLVLFLGSRVAHVVQASQVLLDISKEISLSTSGLLGRVDLAGV